MVNYESSANTLGRIIFLGGARLKYHGAKAYAAG